MRPLIHLIAAAVVFATPVIADAPDIVSVSAQKSSNGWRFDVTLKHPDTGWDHYADGWEILDESGARLGYRELLHPHVNEQPFTRSLSGVTIPDGTTHVLVRARDNVDGWSEETMRFALP